MPTESKNLAAPGNVNTSTLSRAWLTHMVPSARRSRAAAWADAEIALSVFKALMRWSERGIKYSIASMQLKLTETKSMIAKTQYALTAADLEVLLVLLRGGTLAEAGARQNADASTVFRSVQRIEKHLGQRLFERSRQGYLPSETMLDIARHAERIEAELEAARATAFRPSQEVSGRVRVSTTDSVLRGLLLPCLPALATRHPLLQLELRSSNELVSLSKRDADIALRATHRAPEHLIGRRLGTIRFVACASKALPAAPRRKA